MSRRARPGLPRARCENCPKRDHRVRAYDLLRQGRLVRRLLLCEECAGIARRLAEGYAPEAKPEGAKPEDPEGAQA